MATGKEQEDRISLLKDAARDLYTSLQQLKNSRTGDEQVDQALVKSRELFRQMKNFITGILYDLDGTRVQLGRCSNQVLSQVAEQLDKVNESTQDAVQSVLNRVDSICDKQNDVFQQLAILKKNLQDIDESQEKIDLIESASRLETIEGEIQMEAFEIMNEMQFQDITCQQLQQANQLLNDAKAKLTDLHKLLTLFKSDSETGLVKDDPDDKPRTFDPSATMSGRDERQELVDEIEADFNK